MIVVPRKAWRRGEVTGYPVGVRLQPEVLEDLDRLCQIMHRTRSEAVRFVLTNHLQEAIQEAEEKS